MSDRTKPFALHPEFAPSKARGQNFLVEPRMADRLVDALEATRADTILEVGPGTGVLTERLLARAGKVIAVETDRLLFGHLRAQFAGEPRLELIERNFLELDLAFFASYQPRKAISNLPYSITSPALLRLLTSPAPFERLVLTMQKEVAQRLAAPPGNRTYGRLSVLVALAGGIESLFDLPPSVFRPRPRVVSRAIRIRPRPDRSMAEFPGSFLERVIKAAFGTRRKQAAVALTAGLAIPRARIGAALAAAGINPTARAEEIAPPQYERLASELARG